MQPRPYQQSAIERCDAAWSGGAQGVLLCAPTGSGKTVIATSIIRRALESNLRVLYLAHRRELIRQPFVKLVRHGLSHKLCSIVMAGVKPPRPDLFGSGSVLDDALQEGNDHAIRAMLGLRQGERVRDSDLWNRVASWRPDAPVQLASVDTLRRRQVPPADLVIVDEGHRAPSKSYVRVFEALPNARRLLLTATPQRGDGKGFRGVADELVVVSTYRELVASGYLIEPRVWSVPPSALPDLERVRVRGGDYDQGELADEVDREGLIGDIVEHWARRGNGAPTMCFAVSVQHSQHIVERFCAEGVRAEHIDGTTPVRQREDALEALAEGRIQVLSNCDVCTEGTDVPATKTVIMARPTRSLRIYLQQAGRGSRPTDAGYPFVILDHAGNALLHGLPQDDREWSLDGRDKRNSGPAEPPTRVCPTCYAVLPIRDPECSGCGYRFPAAGPVGDGAMPTELDGQLVELRPATEQERWDAVVAEWHRRNEARRVPLMPGWCWHRYRELHGRPPPAGVAPAQWTPEESARNAWERIAGNG